MFRRQIFEVAPSVWCLRRPSYVTCSYATLTAAGVVLIDAGMDSTGDDVIALLHEMGQPPDAVRAILLTHWHNDHVAGAAATQRATACGVYHHAADGPWLMRANAKRGFRGWLARRIPEAGIGVLFIGLLGEAVPNAVAPSATVSDGQVVAGEFEAIHTPGHTPGHVSYFHRPSRTLFAGDALAVVRGEVRFMARPVTMDLGQARASMKRCLDRPIEILCPGHREPLTVDVGERCAAMLERLESREPWPLLG